MGRQDRHYRLTMLGTGNALVTKCFNTCFALRCDEQPDNTLLVDAGGGNGILAQLERANIPYSSIHDIFITHAHTDHIMGIIWVLRKISPMMNHGTYTGELHLYGHDEVIHAIITMCELLLPAKIRRPFGEQIIFHTITHGQNFTLTYGLKMQSFDIGSTKTKQFGFRASLEDGQTLVCLGDEPYKEQCEEFVVGADWLMCEAFCLYGDRLKFHPYEKHHSTALDAGRIAADLKVKNVIIYHTEDHTLATRKDTYAKEVTMSFGGNVYVPDDLETITL